MHNEPQPRRYDANDESLEQNRFNININIFPATNPFSNKRGYGYCNKHEDKGSRQDDRPDFENTRHGLLRFWL